MPIPMLRISEAEAPNTCISNAMGIGTRQLDYPPVSKIADLHEAGHPLW